MFDLTDAEYRLMEVVWEVEPIRAAALAVECNERLGWKRTTTYTVINNCAKKGYLATNDSVVTPLVTKSEYNVQIGERLMENVFHDGMAEMLSAFVSGRKLTKEEYEQLKDIIEKAYR